MVADELRLVRPGNFHHQQVERRLGRLELVAFVLQVLHAVEDFLHQLVVGVEPVFGRLGDDVRPAGELADQDPPLVADRFGIDVLVALRDAVDGVDVHPAFVGEGARPDERLARAEVHVGDLVDVARQLGQMGHAAGHQHVVPFLEHEVGNHADQVDVAAPLADAVDGPLHLDGAVPHGDQRIGRRHVAVVMAVDADRDREAPGGPRRRPRRSARAGCRRWCRTARRSPRPPSWAAWIVRRAKSGLRAKPSKKCSAS